MQEELSEIQSSQAAMDKIRTEKHEAYVKNKVSPSVPPPPPCEADRGGKAIQAQVRRAWCGETVACLLEDEPDEVLDLLDPCRAWGRPVSAEAAGKEVAAVVPGVQPRWQEGSLIRQIRVTVHDKDKAVGFAECAVVRRKPVEEVRACRICMETQVDMLEGMCACRGTMRFLCTDCLIKNWSHRYKTIADKSHLACDLCHQHFQGRAMEMLTGQLEAAVKKDTEARPEPPKEEEMDRCSAEIAVATKLWQQGKYPEAAMKFEKVIARLQELAGPDDAKVLSAQHNLSLVLLAQGKAKQALIHVQTARNGFAKILGVRHSLTLKAAHNEALVVQSKGEFAQARIMYEKVLEDRIAVLGLEHLDTLKTHSNLGLVLLYLNEPVPAEGVFRAALAGLERVVGRTHPLALTVLQNLSLTLAARSQVEGVVASLEAEELAREAATGRQRTLGADHPDTMEGRRDLASVLVSCGKVEEGEETFRQALAGMERLLGFDHPNTKAVLWRLHTELCQNGRGDRAERLLEEHSKQETVSEATELPLTVERGILVLVVLGIFVAPVHRKQGIGKTVLSHFQALAKELRCEMMETTVRLEASDAINFFTACNFKETRPAPASKKPAAPAGGEAPAQATTKRLQLAMAMR